MKKKNKFPYPNFKAQELYDLEMTHYFLLMGGDSVCVDGTYTFTQKEVIKIYNEMLAELVGMMHDGLSNKDKRYATDLIASLVVVPVRIH